MTGQSIFCCSLTGKPTSKACSEVERLPSRGVVRLKIDLRSWSNSGLEGNLRNAVRPGVFVSPIFLQAVIDSAHEMEGMLSCWLIGPLSACTGPGWFGNREASILPKSSGQDGGTAVLYLSSALRSDTAYSKDLAWPRCKVYVRPDLEYVVPVSSFNDIGGSVL